MKTEKEKMLSEASYLASDSELAADRQQIKAQLFDFNNMPPGKADEGNRIIRKIFYKTGNEFTIEPPFRCDYAYNIEIGDKFYSNFNLTILDSAKVHIGNNVFIGPNVSLYTVSHPLDFKSRNPEVEFAQSIRIGNNVWIGGNVVVNPGVRIGNNSVIGSGSIVVKDIPDNVVAVGNPCCVIKQIANEN